MTFNSLHAGYFSCFFYCLLIYFKINFFEKFFQEFHSCQTGWIQIRPDIFSGLIWIQTSSKGYQQKTLVGRELRKYRCKMIQLSYTEPHFQRKMVLEDNLNSRIFKTKFGVVISINLHALLVHITQLTILSRFTEYWYVRSKPVFCVARATMAFFSHLSVHEVYDTIAD